MFFCCKGPPPSRFSSQFCKNSSLQWLLMNLSNNTSFVDLPPGFKQEPSFAAWTLSPGNKGPFSTEVAGIMLLFLSHFKFIYHLYRFTLCVSPFLNVLIYSIVFIRIPSFKFHIRVHTISINMLLS